MKWGRRNIYRQKKDDHFLINCFTISPQRITGDRERLHTRKTDFDIRDLPEHVRTGLQFWATNLEVAEILSSAISAGFDLNSILR